MTKREAKEWGKDIGEQIILDGDFTQEELDDEDKFSQAFWEIVQNRQQYAGVITENFKRDSEWQGYHEGLAISLRRYCRKHFWKE